MVKGWLVALMAVAATAAPPAFEAASVKPNKVGSAGGEGHTREKIEHSPVTLTMTNVTLNSCVKWAYGVRDFQILDAPGWFASERYDIAAKTLAPASEDEFRLMLRALLAERFGLAVRVEKKERPVYALAVGKNGPRLHRAAGDGAGGMRPGDGVLVFHNVSMADFADRLANRPLKVDRPVLDRTGLTGTYDFSLKFAENAAELKSSLEGMERGDPGGPSVFTIIEEQLGLRLDSRKDSIDVLIVEHAGKIPSDN
jgi:uncharacterized protein (TIGR03435 family)